MADKNNIKDLVLQGRDEGNVIFLQHGDDDFVVMSTPIEEFIQQPADGILYDLNRLEETALTYIDDPKWVNDFAVALTIRALKEERDALLAVARAANILDLQRLADYIRSVQRSEVEDWEWPQDIEKLINALAALHPHLRGDVDE